MDLFRALDISASGLSAHKNKMEVIAENLANTDTLVTRAGGPYQRKGVVMEAADGHGFPATLRGESVPEGGVQVSRVVELPDPPRRVYEPGHPHASTDGFVSYPNVVSLTEMVDMLATTRAYEANASAFQATKSMGTKLLELLR